MILLATACLLLPARRVRWTTPWGRHRTRERRVRFVGVPCPPGHMGGARPSVRTDACTITAPTKWEWTDDGTRGQGRATPRAHRGPGGDGIAGRVVRLRRRDGRRHGSAGASTTQNWRSDRGRLPGYSAELGKRNWFWARANRWTQTWATGRGRVVGSR